MDAAFLDLIACPRCQRRLHLDPGSTVDAGTLRCRGCGPYPLLGGVPILVPDPATWCASYRDAALAALAEHGHAGRKTVAIVRAFADAAPAAEPARFGDDWTAHERAQQAPPALIDGPHRARWDAFAAAAAADGPDAWLAARAPRGVLVELGPGAGALSARLAQIATHLIVADLSLRAALVAAARATAGKARDRAAVLPIVADAAALPIRRRAAHAVIAANVIDLLDEPAALFAGVARALRRGGHLLLATPAPDLGTGDDDVVARLAHASGFRTVDHAGAVPWLRAHSPRHVELYVAAMLHLRAP